MTFQKNDDTAAIPLNSFVLHNPETFDRPASVLSRTSN